MNVNNVLNILCKYFFPAFFDEYKVQKNRIYFRNKCFYSLFEQYNASLLI